MAKCSIDGCEKEVRARGLCSTHYRRWQIHGDPGDAALLRESNKDKFCAIHPDRPVRARGMCGSCYNKWLMDGYDVEKKELILARKRKQWAKKYASRNGIEHAKYQKNRVLQHRYGIDLDEYERMFKSQENKCMICGKIGGDTKGTRLYVDHNHKNGRVRALLCCKCNKDIAVLEDGTGRIVEMAKYLNKYEPCEAWNCLAKLELMLREIPKEG